MLRRSQSCKDLGDNLARLKEQQVYKPQGVNKLGMLMGEKENQCGYYRIREGEIGKR